MTVEILDEGGGALVDGGGGVSEVLGGAEEMGEMEVEESSSPTDVGGGTTGEGC